MFSKVKNKENLFVPQTLRQMHCGNTYFDEAEIERAANYLCCVGLLQGCVDLSQGPNTHASNHFFFSFLAFCFCLSSLKS